ncbi:hypothetical protein DGWBC_0699 [Dehalogenimonas sp. WBC-2]|nr:hypothetical protein DGWBC_0699 [Dehalogenimonas sp. WBC-2]
MLGLAAIKQLAGLELRKVFKGKAFYIVTALIVIFVGLAAINTSGIQYQSQEDMMRQQLDQSLLELDRGQFGSVLTVFENGGSFGPPPGIDPIGKPLRDETGTLIPENIEFYRQMYTNYVEEQIASLPPENSISDWSAIGNTANQVASMVPMMAAVLGVGIFASDFKGGYRLMISRGVRRSNLMAAKLFTSLGVALLLTLVFTAVLTFGILFSGNADGVSGITASSLLGIFWVGLLMFTAYMLVGGAIGVILASPSSAMGAALAFAFISASFFFNLTPKDDFFLAAFSPVSLGYNFNSLMYYVWRAGEETDRYRSVILSVVIAVTYIGIYVSAIYYVFNKKQLKG